MPMLDLKPVIAAIALAVAGASGVAAQSAAPHHATGALVQPVQHAPDCLCRAAGRNFAVGETACLRAPEGLRLAECGMVLNNTSWRFTDRPCPES